MLNSPTPSEEPIQGAWVEIARFEPTQGSDTEASVTELDAEGGHTQRKNHSAHSHSSRSVTAQKPPVCALHCPHGVMDKEVGAVANRLMEGADGSLSGQTRVAPEPRRHCAPSVHPSGSSLLTTRSADPCAYVSPMVENPAHHRPNEANEKVRGYALPQRSAPNDTCADGGEVGSDAASAHDRWQGLLDCDAPPFLHRLVKRAAGTPSGDELDVVRERSHVHGRAGSHQEEPQADAPPLVVSPNRDAVLRTPSPPIMSANRGPSAMGVAQDVDPQDARRSSASSDTPRAVLHVVRPHPPPSHLPRSPPRPASARSGNTHPLVRCHSISTSLASSSSSLASAPCIPTGRSSPGHGTHVTVPFSVMAHNANGAITHTPLGRAAPSPHLLIQPIAPSSTAEAAPDGLSMTEMLSFLFSARPVPSAHTQTPDRRDATASQRLDPHENVPDPQVVYTRADIGADGVTAVFSAATGRAPGSTAPLAGRGLTSGVATPTTATGVHAAGHTLPSAAVPANAAGLPGANRQSCVSSERMATQAHSSTTSDEHSRQLPRTASTGSLSRRLSFVSSVASSASTERDDESGTGDNGGDEEDRAPVGGMVVCPAWHPSAHLFRSDDRTSTTSSARRHTSKQKGCGANDSGSLSRNDAARRTDPPPPTLSCSSMRLATVAAMSALRDNLHAQASASSNQPHQPASAPISTRLIAVTPQSQQTWPGSPSARSSGRLAGVRNTTYPAMQRRSRGGGGHGGVESGFDHSDVSTKESGLREAGTPPSSLVLCSVVPADDDAPRLEPQNDTRSISGFDGTVIGATGMATNTAPVLLIHPLCPTVASAASGHTVLTAKSATTSASSGSPPTAPHVSSGMGDAPVAVRLSGHASSPALRSGFIESGQLSESGYNGASAPDSPTPSRVHRHLVPKAATTTTPSASSTAALLPASAASSPPPLTVFAPATRLIPSPPPTQATMTYPTHHVIHTSSPESSRFSSPTSRFAPTAPTTLVASIMINAHTAQHAAQAAQPLPTPLLYTSSRFAAHRRASCTEYRSDGSVPSPGAAQPGHGYRQGPTTSVPSAASGPHEHTSTQLSLDSPTQLPQPLRSGNSLHGFVRDAHLSSESVCSLGMPSSSGDAAANGSVALTNRRQWSLPRSSTYLSTPSATEPSSVSGRGGGGGGSDGSLPPASLAPFRSHAVASASLLLRQPASHGTAPLNAVGRPQHYPSGRPSATLLAHSTSLSVGHPIEPPLDAGLDTASDSQLRQTPFDLGQERVLGVGERIVLDFLPSAHSSNVPLLHRHRGGAAASAATDTGDPLDAAGSASVGGGRRGIDYPLGLSSLELSGSAAAFSMWDEGSRPSMESLFDSRPPDSSFRDDPAGAA